MQSAWTHELRLRVRMDYDGEIWERVVATASIRTLAELELLNASLHKRTEDWEQVSLTFGELATRRSGDTMWQVPVRLDPESEAALGEAMAAVGRDVPESCGVARVDAFVRDYGPKDRAHGQTGTAKWLTVDRAESQNATLVIRSGRRRTRPRHRRRQF